jgi:hypothetical protein
MKQVWFCEKCCTVGCVDILRDEVYAVVRSIKISHLSLSPQCDNAVALLRCINSNLITSCESMREDPEIPSWVVEPASQFLGFPVSQTQLDRELESILRPLRVEIEPQDGGGTTERG